MHTQAETRRYLARMDTRAVGHLYTDCLVIGGGSAGLRAALAAAEAGTVLVLVKDVLPESNSYYAQGGIAAVLRAEDDFESHIQDTLKTGCGLCDRDVVEMVVRQGPGHIHDLLEWGTPFDMDGESLATGREGGHSQSRVAHALGDATGRAISTCLSVKAKRHANIKIFEHCFCIDLLTDEDRCLGALTWHPKYGFQCIWSHRTILASGGAGRLWRETSNPDGATGDGLAIAWRAGAVLSDLEFMQFHPTTLYIAGASRMLITEALRGAGGLLVDGKGRRFMQDYHEMGELAPRDVVSRAIFDYVIKTGATNVYLDVRHLGAAWMRDHFPTISQVCASFDIDVEKNLIPVRPSAHYMIGGIKTDTDGRTSIAHLYACGEAASTGLHGSNRLASNSLLESLVFGKVCGEHAAHEIAALRHIDPESRRIVYEIDRSQRTKMDIPDVTNSLRAVMWRNVGVARNEERLTETVEIIDFWRRYVMDKVFDGPMEWQCQNMLTVCRLVSQVALDRRETRGVHFRSDYPERDDTQFNKHFEYVAEKA